MRVVHQITEANAAYVAAFPGPSVSPPRRELAVVACMDSRLDLLPALGLQLGDAHIIRNAGGLPTDEVLRSLAISQRALGTREIVIIHHTRCGMEGFDDEGFRAQIADETGAEPPWDVPGLADVRAALRQSVATVRKCPYLPHRDDVCGFIYDVDTGRLESSD